MDLKTVLNIAGLEQRTGHRALYTAPYPTRMN